LLEQKIVQFTSSGLIFSLVQANNF